MKKKTVPRPEYPRPQYLRKEWLNLNGEWMFADDASDDGEERGLHTQNALPESIQVPFCRESPLSGIDRQNRIMAVWYKKHIKIPGEWTNKRVLIHFGAADYETTLWVDGKKIGFHEGGHCSFSFDITDFASRDREHILTVRCRDSWLDAKPRGKQVASPDPHGCMYLRTTGIWQTVWLEPVPETRILRPRITPLPDSSCFMLELGVKPWTQHMELKVSLHADGAKVAEAATALESDFTATLILPIPEHEKRTWDPASPFLYDMKIDLLKKGELVDSVQSYAGLRSVAVSGNKVLLNGKPVFQRLVLDQGYYPDGILTAPDDESLVNDIKLAIKAGFNGARLHQKIFEERFLYHADRLGYLVWGEMPDWTADMNLKQADKQRRWNELWITEWQEELERDYSHPCIVGWCPMNEQMYENEEQKKILDRLMSVLYISAKLADRTRPVLDVSGWPHRVPGADIYDNHDYNSSPEDLENRYSHTAGLDLNREPLKHKNNKGDEHVPYEDQPFFLSEFGGIPWTAGDNSWGYGRQPKSMEEFYQRFEGQCAALLSNPGMFGYCYTQLTDVFQEQNGIFTFDRKPKFELERIRAAQSGPAAVEK